MKEKVGEICLISLAPKEFYGDLVHKLKKSVGFYNFSSQFIKIFPIIRRLVITLMNCNRLHAWLSS